MEPNTALRDARLEQGWSQSFLAAQLGTSPKNVSRWERGDTRPSPYFRAKLCQLFGTTAHALGFVPPPASPAPPQAREDAVVSQQSFTRLVDPALPFSSFSRTPVVGREAICENILSILSTGQTCALHGLPGVGKTTLAQAIAFHEDIHTYFPDGILWVGLGPSPDSISQLTRWALLLGVFEEAMRTEHSLEMLQLRVRQGLSARRMLLVIDDAWTSEAALPFLLGGLRCAHLLTTRFPHVALLVTENEPLPVTELGQQETLQLLTTLVPALTTLDNTQLYHLVQLTGGLPLAVNLVARYLRLHAYSGQPRRLQTALASLAQAETRLHLTSPQFSATHPAVGTALSLHTVIALSDHHLTPQAQQALRTLSVLPTKPEQFSEVAALAVCQQDAAILDQLCDAGLLESAGPGWYWMHQTIADYGQVCLKAEHPEEVGPWRHLVNYALHFLAAQGRNGSQVEREHTTLLAALNAAHSHKWQPEQLALTKKLSQFWALHGYTTLARERFSQALALARDVNDTLGVCWMLFCLGALAETQGALQDARQYFEEGLTLLRPSVELHVPLLKALLNSLGIISGKQGNLRQSETFYQQALELARMQEEPFEMCILLNNLGELALKRGQLVRAKQIFQEILEMSQGHDLALQGEILCGLGDVCMLQQGDEEEAFALYQQAFALSEREHLSTPFCDACLGLGLLAQRQNQREDAHTWFQKGMLSAQKHGLYEQYINGLAALATLAPDIYTYTRAEQMLQEAMELAQRMKHSFSLCRCYITLGTLYLNLQRYEEAQLTFETAKHLITEECVLLHLEIQEGLAHSAAAQGNVVLAQQMAERNLSLMEALHHWKRDEGRLWLEQQYTLNPPQARKTTLNPPAQPPRMTQVSPGQSEALSDRTETSGDEEVTCPDCAHAYGLVKHSRNRSGSQRYQCPACGKVFTPFPRQIGKDVQDKVLAQQLAATGMSQRAIGRQLGVHHTTVKVWLTRGGSIESSAENGP